jgi:hypothetical protein
MTSAAAKRDPPYGEAPEARAAKPKGPRSLGAAATFRLEAPRLRTTGDAGEERRATWFGLYFDLEETVLAMDSVVVQLCHNRTASYKPLPATRRRLRISLAPADDPLGEKARAR